MWINQIPGIAVNSNSKGLLFSQYEEQAIIEFILHHIKTPTRFFVDIGAGAYGDSEMSNTRALAEQGWHGFGIDAADNSDPRILKAFVRPMEIVILLKNLGTPQSFDFLNLDIDSSDFWVLKQMLSIFHPRLICCEFNGCLDPEVSKVLRYEEGYIWDKTDKYGFSFAAGKKLLGEYGYTIIYNQDNLNIFAVKTNLLKVYSKIPVEEIVVTASQNQYHPHNPAEHWEMY